MAVKTLKITDNLYDYILSVSLHDNDILKQLRDETSKNEYAAEQIISPDEGQFISFILKTIGAKRTIEIGILTGYSTLCTALALPEDGKIVACDIDENMAEIARKYWKLANVEKKIDLFIAPANQTLDRLLQNEDNLGSFDYAFIDADKENFDDYFEKCLALIRVGGLILIDNVLMAGNVIGEAPDYYLGINHPAVVSVDKLNKKLKDDKRVDISLVSIGDGVLMIRKL